MMINKWLQDKFGKPIPGMGDWAENEFYGSTRMKFPLQPRNTSSNLAYLLTGIVVAAAVSTASAVVFGLAMAVLGVGSTLYHGWPTKGTQELDHFGMYAVFGALLVSALGGPWFAMLGIAALLGLSLFTVDLPLEIGVGATFAATLGILSWPGLNSYGAVAILFFMLSYAAWRLDRIREVTGYWGHFIWHIGTAIAIGLMYMATL